MPSICVFVFKFSRSAWHVIRSSFPPVAPQLLSSWAFSSATIAKWAMGPWGSHAGGKTSHVVPVGGSRKASFSHEFEIWCLHRLQRVLVQRIPTSPSCLLDSSACAEGPEVNIPPSTSPRLRLEARELMTSSLPWKQTNVYMIITCWCANNTENIANIHLNMFR